MCVHWAEGVRDILRAVGGCSSWRRKGCGLQVLSKGTTVIAMSSQQATIGRRWWQIRKNTMVEIVCQMCARPIRTEVPQGWTVDEVITAETLGCPCGLPLARLMLPEAQLIPSLRSWRKRAYCIMTDMLVAPAGNALMNRWIRMGMYGPLSEEQIAQIVCIIHWKQHAEAKGNAGDGKRRTGAGAEETGRDGAIRAVGC